MLAMNYFGAPLHASKVSFSTTTEYDRYTCVTRHLNRCHAALDTFILRLISFCICFEINYTEKFDTFFFKYLYVYMSCLYISICVSVYIYIDSLRTFHQQWLKEHCNRQTRREQKKRVRWSNAFLCYLNQGTYKPPCTNSHVLWAGFLILNSEFSCY